MESALGYLAWQRSNIDNNATSDDSRIFPPPRYIPGCFKGTRWSQATASYQLQ